MNAFTTEFNTLSYIIDQSRRVLLVAHTRPDPDAAGSVLAFKGYLEGKGIHVDIACFNAFPAFISDILEDTFHHPDTLDLTSYDALIGCDSVDRGFNEMITHLRDDQVTVAIDHHPDITVAVDLKMIDADYAATCEILYNYFLFAKAEITQKMATALLLGILGDTGNFQHANTTGRVLDIAADLIAKGADASKIVNHVFANRSITTLKLWGKALEKARIDEKSGMIMTALTQDDLGTGNPTSEDVKEVASILNTVPGTTFSLIIFQIGQNRIKGSLRTEKGRGIDVSTIAATLNGGGHHLASGFELDGSIIETTQGWEVI